MRIDYYNEQQRETTKTEDYGPRETILKIRHFLTWGVAKFEFLAHELQNIPRMISSVIVPENDSL